MATSILTKEFTDEVLQAHNKYRARHDAPNLAITEELNKLAQEWAMTLASKDKAEHRPNNKYGENVYMGMNTDPKWVLNGDVPVTAWYNEIKSYKFGEKSPKNPGAVGHFTQLIWKESKDLGIGAGKSKSGRIYVVCNYNPSGNVIPEFAKNVLPMKKSAKSVRISRGSFDPEAEEDLGYVVPTPSQEKVGIHFVPKNAKDVKSMERLYAVPSEKMRVWSVWLSKVEEKAIEWHRWICTHLNLILRMSTYLQRAEKAIKQEGAIEPMRSHDEEHDHEDVEIEVEKASMPADAGQRFEKLSEEIRTSKNQESNRSQRGTTAGKGTIVSEEEEKTGRKVTRSVVSEKKSVRSESEKDEAEKKLENERGKEANDDSRNKSKEKNRRETLRDDSEETEEDETEKLEKIAWPIGVPWEPVVQVAIEETKVSKKKEEKVKTIPIPENEEDMEEFIKKVKEQATIFRSLYKHWREVGDQAINAVVNRNVMDSESVPTVEDIPYFFYVDTEPDIEIGVEHDDEKILLPDLTRERIVSDFTPLYFNLADKPGKG